MADPTSFLADLNTKRKTAIAVFHQFRVRATGPLNLHVFYEGYDDSCFYARHLRKTSEELGWEIKDYVAFGKRT